MPFGFGSLAFSSAPSTVLLKLRSQYTDTDGQEQTQISLLELAKASLPPCRLSPFLFNGHLQTAWTAMDSQDVHVFYKRRVFRSAFEKFPGQFAVDFVVPQPKNLPKYDPDMPPRTVEYEEDEWKAFEQEDDEKPLLIVLHGLSGGSDEQYLRHMLKPLTEEHGFAACVINARGCAKSKITSPIMYNARATWDIRQLVKWARDRWPKRRLFAAGFSLGANILTNYVGEEGDACVLDAAIAVCNPWNLEVCNTMLNSTWIGLNVYSAAMGKGMRNLTERHAKEIAENTKVDLEKVRKTKYLWEWDRHVQCPTWGYPTESAYYRDASSTDSVLSIRIPFLALHARDDPIVYDGAVPYEEIKVNPYTVICATSKGGHLSYYELGSGRWYTRALCAFLSKFVDDTTGMSKKHANGSGSKAASSAVDLEKPVYEPMRRRMAYPSIVREY